MILSLFDFILKDENMMQLIKESNICVYSSSVIIWPQSKIVKARILKIPWIFQDFLNPKREPTSSLAVYPGLVLTSMALEVSSLLQPVQLKWYGW